MQTDSHDVSQILYHVRACIYFIMNDLIVHWFAKGSLYCFVVFDLRYGQD